MPAISSLTRDWRCAARGTLLLCLSSVLPGIPANRLLAASPDGGSRIELSEFFERHVRPLLLSHCIECHGPDVQESGLRLDSRQALLDGGDSGPVIVPGASDQSLLIQAVRQSGDLQMPPDAKLSDEQIAQLEHWVEQGAPWPAGDLAAPGANAGAKQTHWAFQPIGSPEPPAVHNSAWLRTPVDAFVMAQLESHGLLPSPRADKRTLIRRVTYDLTGLPPTPDEVGAFVHDDDPEAYAKVVERLLASPRYGEQWARHWLDLARYSDSKGYVYAREERMFVHAPAYRDWVVRALNDDMPYDKFLLLQIAADLVAPADRSSLAALGFLTGGRRFLGITHDIIDDRIDVVSRTALGLTVACARCHDHKYDPIPTEDYYSLYGVFQNCTERLVRIGEVTAAEPAKSEFEEELQKREQALDQEMAKQRSEASERARQRIADYLFAQTELEKYPEEAFNQVVAKEDLVAAFVRRWQNFLDVAAAANDPIFLPWRRYRELPEASFAAGASQVTRELSDADEHAINPLVAKAFATPPRSLRDAAERYGRLFARIDEQWRALPENADPGQRRLADPAAAQLLSVLHGAQAPCEVPDEPIVSTELYFDTATIDALWHLQGEVDRWLIQSPSAPAYALALCDRVTLQEPRVFRRGNPAAKGATAPRRFLALLSPPERPRFTRGSGRLELAQAIVARDNPLTARVWANRVWMHHFGAGLVRTPSDFGVRAEAPSHPALLDWLARQLLSHQWSTKALHRAIVLSAAYQQSSISPADEHLAKRARDSDPENRLLWRANRRRLSFEQWRDSMLAASESLDLRMGGRGADLFATAPENVRRTLYGVVDRQFLPSTLRVFDFANPDLHIPQRSETIVPQQALFALNHPLVANRARALAARLDEQPLLDATARVRRLYQQAFQRDPTQAQIDAALVFVLTPSRAEAVTTSSQARDWQYGYGEFSESDGRVHFEPLPYFTGAAWQGGPEWPDAKLGWVQLTAAGGHPGNDAQHAVIRRWTAPCAGVATIRSTATHREEVGNGINCSIVSSRQGLLKSASVHNGQETLEVEALIVEAGDTVDFIADVAEDLNSDQFLWTVDSIVVARATSEAAPSVADEPWNSQRNFGGEAVNDLTPWEQLAQVLLLSNEFSFVD
jgi:hypothetical protein